MANVLSMTSSGTDIDIDLELGLRHLSAATIGVIAHKYFVRMATWTLYYRPSLNPPLTPSKC